MTPALAAAERNIKSVAENNFILNSKRRFIMTVKQKIGLSLLMALFAFASAGIVGNNYDSFPQPKEYIEVSAIRSGAVIPPPPPNSRMDMKLP